MSEEENKAVVRRYLEDAWNAGDLAAIDTLFAPELVDEVKARMQTYLTAFPDWHCVIDEIVAEGTTVANRWTGTATHTGPLFGIPPTGVRVSLPGITIHHLREGRIVREWSQADVLGVLQQIGAMPGPGGPSQ